MNDTRKHFEDMAEHRSAAHAAAFLQRLGMDSHGEFICTGVRSDWMEQDGPAVPLAFFSDALGRPIITKYINTDFIADKAGFSVLESKTELTRELQGSVFLLRKNMSKRF